MDPYLQLQVEGDVLAVICTFIFVSFFFAYTYVKSFLGFIPVERVDFFMGHLVPKFKGIFSSLIQRPCFR